jgi:hypothetical protein
MIDRQAQRTRTYTGIDGINTQDRAVQESMGAIADRSLERLGTTDVAIIAYRRHMLKALQRFQEGVDPPGTQGTYYKLRAIEKVLPDDTNWFEAMKAELCQLEEPPAATAANVG